MQIKQWNISDLGYQISWRNISWPKANQQNCENKKELEFFGLINFYSGYLPRYIVSLLNYLLKCIKNVEFIWTQKQNKAFEALKKVLTSKQVIKIFDAEKEVTLTTDASERAITAVVSEEGHPIRCLSRKLSSTECNYSNIEKEALAIVWRMERAQNFSDGKKAPLKIRRQALGILIQSEEGVT